jgi:hypothetical protein
MNDVTKKVEDARRPNGQFGTQERAEPVNVHLPGAPAVADYADEVSDLDNRWRNMADLNGEFNDEIAVLAQRVLEASEPDRPGYERLRDALESFNEDLEDDDAAEVVLDALETITSRNNMKVSHGIRLADGRPAISCPACDNEYATQAVLAAHQNGDCTALYDAHAAQLSVGDRVLLAPSEAATVTSLDGDHKQVSIEFDNDEETIANYDPAEVFQVVGQTDQEFVEEADHLYDIADEYISSLEGEEVNAFLRREGFTDHQIADALDDPDEGQFALDELARNHAYEIASTASNNDGTVEWLEARLSGEFSNPAYPNGRCHTCGHGRDLFLRCQNEDCSTFGH